MGPTATSWLRLLTPCLAAIVAGAATFSILRRPAEPPPEPRVALPASQGVPPAQPPSEAVAAQTPASDRTEEPPHRIDDSRGRPLSPSERAEPRALQEFKQAALIQNLVRSLVAAVRGKDEKRAREMVARLRAMRPAADDIVTAERAKATDPAVVRLLDEVLHAR